MPRPKLSELTLREKIGQTGMPGPAQIRAGVVEYGGYDKYLTAIPFGGVHLDANIIDKDGSKPASPQEVGKMYADAANKLKIPMFVTCDFEYGAKPIFDVEDILCEYYNSFGNIIDLDKAKSFNLSKLYKAVYKKANVSTNTPKKSVTMGEKQGSGKLFAKKSNETLSKKAEIVYNRINSDFFTIDDLRETGFSVSEIFSAVTELELRGLVKAVPGGRYTKL